MKEVLIVEDNEDNSLLTEKILNYYGFKTTISANGQSALKYCETHQPDLILMDLSLPDINGLELTTLLRKKDRFKNTPIIALTAHTIQGTVDRQKSVLSDSLAKPFLPNDLITVIRKYLH